MRMAQSAPVLTDESTRSTPHVVPDDAIVEETAAGGLVYEPLTEYRVTLDADVRVGRRLIGFTGVDNWAGIRDELRARGHGTGATRHLPTFRRE